MANIVDLRSDTVTKPSPEMRSAIANAEVGDDVLGDDPTVHRLEARMAEMLGKDEAVFVPSGSMANQIAIRAVSEPGDEIICSEMTHSFNYEGGGPAALSGCSLLPLRGARGQFTGSDVDAAIRPDDVHFPRSRLVIIENTNNRGGGAVWPIDAIRDVSDKAQQHGLHLHLDGARLWNACVAARRQPRDYANLVDSVSMCFSKGMGAPIGSILAGDAAFIKRARRFRKLFGGGMRQAGLLAAAALYAIDHNFDRLAEDHDNAQALAQAIADLPGIVLDPQSVETNIVIFELQPALAPATDFVARLHERGVWMLATAERKVRAVTHLDVNRAQIEQAITIIREACNTA